MSKENRINEMLEVMQGIDRNGDWKGAPINRFTVEAMYTSLKGWYRDSCLAYVGDMVEVLEDMHAEVYRKVWDEEAITEVEYALFTAMTADFRVYDFEGAKRVILRDRDLLLTIKREYDEEWVLNELKENLYAAVDDMLSKYDNDPEYDGAEFITITVGGKSHKLLLGGPQVAGMELLIENICNENGYAYPVRECEK